MARKTSTLSYAGLTIAPSQAGPAIAPVPETAQPTPTASAKPAGSTMRDHAAPFTLYLHKDAAKALKRYALEQDTKVHTLLLDAVEDWFRRKGLRESVRVTVEQSGRKSSG